MNKSFSRWWGLVWKWTHGPFSPKKTKPAKKPAAPGKQELWPPKLNTRKRFRNKLWKFCILELGREFPGFSPPEVLANDCALKCGLCLPAAFLLIPGNWGLFWVFFFPLEPQSPISLFLSSMRAKHHFPFDLTHRWVQLGTLVFNNKHN